MDEKRLDLDIENFKSRVIAVLEDETVRYWMDSLEVSRSVVSHKWIKGISLPKIELLWRIIEIKRLSPNWLFFDYGPKHLADLDKEAPSSSHVGTAERFIRLFPTEVQDYISHAVRLLPDAPNSNTMFFLSNTLNLLVEYLQREKNQTSLVPMGTRFDYKMQIDEKGCLTDCNDKMLDDFSLDPDQVYGTAYELPVDPKDIDRFKTMLAQLSKDNPVNARIRMEMPTGVSQWQEWFFEAEFNDAGHKIKLTGSGVIVPPERIRKR